MSLISVTPKFDAFVKFCSEQDPAKVINHLGGYDMCAIGEFTPTYNELFSNDEEFDEESCVVMYDIQDEIDVVSSGFSVVFNDKIGNGAKHLDIATYGGISSWLNTLQHQIHEAAQ